MRCSVQVRRSNGLLQICDRVQGVLPQLCLDRVKNAHLLLVDTALKALVLLLLLQVLVLVRVPR